MPSGRKHISLDEVSSGMVLADDLLDANGRILITQGATLTDDMIRSLQRHQIATVSIFFGEVSADDAAAELALQEERLAQLFRKPDNPDEATGLLEQHVRRFRLGATS
jgi:hypothetical protein